MDNKDKILNAALKLFIKEGFHGTSTSKIAKEAGISNGTLFYHFKTKQLLINRLYLTIKENHKNYILENLDTSTTSKNKIKQCWFSFVKWALENQDSMTFYIMFSSSPYIDKLSKEEGCRNFTFMYEIILDAIKDESIIDVDPNLIIHLMSASTHAYINFTNNNPDMVEEYMDIAFKMYWRSIVNI